MLQTAFNRSVKEMIPLVLIILTGATNLFGQTGTITGTVHNEPTGKPLAEANVALFPLGIGDITDKTGSFTLIEVPQGTYEMVVSYMGFRDYTQKVLMFPGKTVSIEVMLQPEVTTLPELTIADSGIQLLPYPFDLISLANSPPPVAGDIGLLLRETPNISAIRKGGTNLDPVLRGFRSGQLNVQINEGIKVEGGCPNRMDPASSHVDINDVKEIRVYKGPYALRYGPSMGGILRIQTDRPGPYSRFETHIKAAQTLESNYLVTRSHLDVEGGNRFFFFDLSGNFNKAGNYKAGNGDVLSSRYTQYNYSLLAGITPGKNHSASVQVMRYYGRNVMFPALPMDERSDDTRIISVDYNGKSLTSHWESLKASAFHSKVNHVMDNKERPISDTVVAVSSVCAIDYGFRAEAGLSLGKHSLIAGVDFENILKDGTRTKTMILQPGMPVKTENLWDDARITNTGIFAEYRVPVGQTELTAATRVDFNEATCQSMAFYGMNGQLIYEIPDVGSSLVNLSISAGILYTVTEKISLGLSLGRGTRSPDMVERFIMLLPIGYDNYDYLGNPQLNAETNNQADLTFHHTCSCSGAFQATLFFSLVEQYITGKEVPPTVVKPQTKGMVGVKQFINIDQAYLYGFECTYTTPETWKLGAKAVASLTRGINPDATRYIVENGQVTGEEQVKNDPLPEIPPLEGTVTVYYKFLKSRLIPEAKVRFVARQNQVSLAYNEQTTPGFITAGLSLRFRYNQSFSVSAGVDNLFNQTYYEHLNRHISGSDQPLYEPGRNVYATLTFTL